VLIQDSNGFVSNDEPESDREFRRRWRKRQGWRRCFWMDFNAFFERICVRHIGKYHRTKTWTSPWWFKLASKLEFWSRPKRAPVASTAQEKRPPTR
jgi:hypothetical protein